MPTTRQIITDVVSLVKGYNRDGTRGVLPVLDKIHRIMRSGDYDTNVYIDPATGFPPYLTTVSGQRQYVLGSTIRKTKYVMVANTDEGYDNYSLYPTIVFDGTTYYEALVTTYPRTRSQNARVIFRDDPGDTTQKFYHAYYLEPASIVSENIQLQVEEQYHDIVIEGCVAWIRRIEYGNSDEWNDWRFNKMPATYWSEQNNQPAIDDLIPLRWG